jgi:hypothetical protein
MKRTGITFLLVFILTVYQNIVFSQAPAVEWNFIYGGSNFDNGTCVLQNKQNDKLVVFGLSHSNNGEVSGNHSGFSDYWIFNLTYTGSFDAQKCIGGSNYDDGKHILKTSDGGYLLTGSAGSSNGHATSNYGSYDFWLVKTDVNFNILWQKNLGGSNFDVAYQTAESPIDGGFVIVGTTYSSNNDVTNNKGFSDFWIAKVNSNGVLQWQKNYGGTDEETAHSVAVLKDNRIAVAGFTKSLDGDVTNPKGNQDAWVLVLDANGNLIWQKSVGGTSTDIATSIIQTFDDNLLVLCETGSVTGDVSNNHGGSDFWLVKLNLSGNIIWSKTYGGNQMEIPGNVIEASDSSLVMVGRTNSNSNGDVGSNYGLYDTWIVKTDTAGVIGWQHTLGGTLNDAGLWVYETSDFGFIIAGNSESSDGIVNGTNKGLADAWVIKLQGKIPLEPGVINENSRKQDILIFPSPASESISVSSSVYGKNVQLSITDFLGREVILSNLENPTKKIDIEKLVNGIYFITVLYNNTTLKSEKFVKF